MQTRNSVVIAPPALHKKIIRETERTTMLKCCPFNKIYYHRERVKIQMLLFTRQLLLSEIPEIFQASSDASLLNG